MIYYGRIGRQIRKKRLHDQRTAYNLRRSQDRFYRSSLWYQTLDLLRIAPSLSSDTIEESALKRILFRDKARHYISKNYIPPRYGKKSLPRTGFRVGMCLI